jgi:hypothetical protein
MVCAFGIREGEKRSTEAVLSEVTKRLNRTSREGEFGVEYAVREAREGSVVDLGLRALVLRILAMWKGKKQGDKES